MKYAKLGDVASYVNGYAFKPEQRGKNGLQIIRIQDLTGNTYDLGFYQGEYPKQIEINTGDVLISWSGSLGIYTWQNGKALLNQHIFKVVFDKQDIEKDYFCLAVKKCLKSMSLKSHGATMKHITKKDFDNIVIPYPSKEEQKKIAKILTTIEGLIELYKKQLNVLDNLVKARFVEMFGNPEINSFDWPVCTLKELVSFEPQNGLYKPQSAYVQDGSGFPIVRIDAFYNGRITNFSALKRLECSESEVQRYLLQENDIVINRVNSIEYLGKCAHIKGLLEETVFESNMMRLHLDDTVMNAVFATKLLCSQYIYKQIMIRAKKAVNQASINQQDVLSFRMFVPPLELQEQFAAFVEQTDKSKYDDIRVEYKC